MTQGILSHIFKTNLCFDFVFKITGIAGYLQSLLYVHASYRVELLTQGFPVLTTGKKLTVCLTFIFVSLIQFLQSRSLCSGSAW